MNIHHLGYLVKKADKSEKMFLQMGYQKETDWIYDPIRDIAVMFLAKDGYRIELVHPTGPDSPYYSLLERFRNTVYHICYEAEQYEETDACLRQQGFVCSAGPEVAVALDNRKVAFYVHPHMGMAELLISTE